MATQQTGNGRSVASPSNQFSGDKPEQVTGHHGHHAQPNGMGQGNGGSGNANLLTPVKCNQPGGRASQRCPFVIPFVEVGA